VPDPLTRQSALAGVPQPGDLIQERTGLWIQRLYAPDQRPGFGHKIGLDLPEQANRSTFANDLHGLWVAPGEWLLVGAETTDWHDLMTHVAENGGALSELSHARTVFRIAAGPARDILAKDCPPGSAALDVYTGPLRAKYFGRRRDIGALPGRWHSYRYLCGAQLRPVHPRLAAGCSPALLTIPREGQNDSWAAVREIGGCRLRWYRRRNRPCCPCRSASQGSGR